MPALLVYRVVSAWPVRTGDLEAQFFLVEVVAGEFEASNADQNDAASFAAHERTLMDGLIALRGSSNDHTIHTPPSGESFSSSQWVFAHGEVDGFRAKRLRQRELPRIKVYS